MRTRLTSAVFFAADVGAGSGSFGDRSPAVSGKAQPGLLLGGRYQLASPIASGGMAQVWRAQDLSLVRQVAIKILHPHLATDEAFVARFRREAVAAAKLSHPSIVAVYDTLSDDGVDAIVMELIEGRTLRAVLDEAGVLPPADVIDVGVQISDALDEAHRAGIVHRDIKPANIMVGADRRIMVTDFGIAKANKDADLTHTGTLLGTAKYLAPEQVAGEPVDPRADIYSLGVVLFEAATGQAPFQADNDAGTALARLQNEVPRCRQRRSDVPVGLDEVIARSMARNPDHRFERASAFASALAAVDLTDVRHDTSDLGPAVVARTSQTGTVMPPPITPGPGNPATIGPPPAGPPLSPNPPTPTPAPAVAPAAQSGTAILTPMADQAGGGRPGGKLTRSQRKAAKRARKAGVGGPPPGSQGRKGRAKKKRASGRQRPTKTIVAVLIIGGLVVSGLLLASLLAPGPATTSGGPPLAILEAIPFDPLGDDGTEGAASAPSAIDGDPDTSWRTARYKREGFAGLKPGVGLILALEADASLGRIELLTGNEDWSAEIYVGNEFGPNDQSFRPDALGEPAATIDGGGLSETVSLGGASGSRVLLWLTETGTSLNVNDEETYRYVLYEATIG